MAITGKQLANAVQIMKLVFEARGNAKYGVGDVTTLAPIVAAMICSNDPVERIRDAEAKILTIKIVEAMVTIKVEAH